MMHSAIRLLPSVSIALLGGASPAAAQVRVELTPLAGLYAPTQYVASSSTGWTLRQEAGLLLGGAVTIWLTRWLGVEGSLGWSGWGVSYPVSDYSCDTAAAGTIPKFGATKRAPAGPSLASPCSGWAPPQSSGGWVTLSSGSLLFDIPLAGHASAYAAIGVTSISRGAIGQQAASVSYVPMLRVVTSHGVVGGVGVRAHLTHTRVTLLAELRDHRYRTQVDVPDPRYGVSGSKIQNDIIVVFGSSLSLNSPFTKRHAFSP